MRSHRLHRLIGYLVIVIALFFTTKAPRAQRNNTDVEIVIVKAQQMTRINPYQTEYEKLLYPTVRITAGYSTGSGVTIDNYILTAAHVVGNESEVNIEANDRVLTATVVITDTAKDLALLRPSQQLTFKAHLAPREYTPYIFSPIWVIGASLGDQPRPTRGELTFVGDGRWGINAPIVPGNSGGGVFDARTYELIGIAVSVRLYGNQLITTMGNIVPINEIYNFLDKHKQ